MPRGNYNIVVPAPGSPHADVTADLVDGLKAAFSELGHAVTVTSRGYGDGVNIVLSTSVVRERLPPPPRRTILYNLEQHDPTSTWFTGQFVELLSGPMVWDYSAKNLASLQRAGLARNGVHVPIGYADVLTRIAPAAVQDIDALFYGSMSARRKDILRELGRRGIKATYAFNAYGERRDALIARAKAVLNIHYYPAKIFEMVRVSFLLANRKAVVCEVDAETDLDDDLRDAVAGAPYDAIADTVERLVRDDPARKALEKRGFEAFRARPQSAFLARAIAQLPWPADAASG